MLCSDLRARAVESSCRNSKTELLPLPLISVPGLCCGFPASVQAASEPPLLLLASPAGPSPTPQASSGGNGQEQFPKGEPARPCPQAELPQEPKPRACRGRAASKQGKGTRSLEVRRERVRCRGSSWGATSPFTARKQETRELVMAETSPSRQGWQEMGCAAQEAAGSCPRLCVLIEARAAPATRAEPDPREAKQQQHKCWRVRG